MTSDYSPSELFLLVNVLILDHHGPVRASRRDMVMIIEM
jgi:hypothetical protein